ncbi:MAG: hypothetical protein KA955_05130 [Prevotella sp.]|nr:hypothetical protein [Prevotella sp.]
MSCVNISVSSQDASAKYRRSSIYSIMIKHNKQQFADSISKVFAVMPVPDKYNDHDLSVKILSIDESKMDNNVKVTNFLEKNMVASRLVAKWFDRDLLNSKCDLNLVKTRGLYNASEFDKALAGKSARGKAMLEDAGEELIGNTFIIANDIRYIDKNKGAKVVGGLFRIIGSAMDAYSGSNSYTSLGNSLGDIADTFKGFTVKIHTYLYQLVWDNESANKFYTQYYSDVSDKSKMEAFDRNRSSYKLKYIGEQLSSGSTTSFMGIKEDEPLVMVRKACQRALDENIANLQKNFEQFKVKVPLDEVSPIKAAIGRKEGITADSKFEVLESSVNEGKTVYKRVGIIAPIPTLIWDNRYMATEEQAYGATLGATTFKKISGGNLYPGLLIREIK